MNSKECLELAILEYEKETIDDENNQWVKNVLKGLKQIKQDLERLEQLEKIIKENFGYNENTKECFFNYDAPVMEEEIKKALGYE